LFGLIAIGAAGLLAACGQAATPTPSAPVKPTEAPKPAEAKPPAAAPSQAAAAPTSAPAAAAASPTTAAQGAPAAKPAAGGAKAKITFMTWGGAERLKIWEEKVVGGFNKANPNAEASLLPAQADYDTKLLTMAAGGTAPDVFRLSQYSAIDYIAKGFTLDLDPYLRRDSLKIEDFCSPPYTQAQYKGKWMAIPHGALGNFVIWYNRDLFKQAGVPFPKPDWTWDQMVEAARALTKGDVFGTNLGQATYPPPYAFLWSNGGDEISEDGKSWGADRPESIDGLQQLVDLPQKDKVSPLPGNIPQGLGDIFLSGKVAMNYTGSWYEATAKQAKFDYAYVNNPKMKGTQTGFSEQNASAGYNKGKSLDAEWDFLKYIISEENQRTEASAGLNQPSHPKLLKDPTYLEIKDPPYDRKPSVPSLLVRTRGATLIPGYSKVYDVWQQKMGSVYAGESKLGDAIKEITAVAKKVIQDASQGA
jgi:multiple sugar transport system substrate-binding protein